jgi:integrase
VSAADPVAFGGERRWTVEVEWDRVAVTAPVLVATIRSYLDRLEGTLAPMSVRAAEVALRQFAGRVVDADPACRAAASVGRAHIDDYKTWLASRPGKAWGSTIAPSTIRHHLGLTAIFFERLIEWGHPDAPAVSPITRSDFPEARRVPATTPPVDPAAAIGQLDRLVRARRTPRSGPPRPVEVTWAEVEARDHHMRATMAAYIEQLSVSARPSTAATTDGILRLFAGRVTAFDPACVAVASIGRAHIEDYKVWLAARPGRKTTVSPRTIAHQLGILRTFFERIIEWGYEDAPARVPIFNGDIPAVDEPLPRALDDPTAARFMAALATDPNPRRRLMVELLARTGIRVSELAGLADDPVVHIAGTHWLRVPVGKLHNDRNIPLHPLLVDLIATWRAQRGPSRSGRLVERDDGKHFDRRTIARYVAVVAQHAGVGHVHPHQLRHTLATQAINRGMSVEAIAALLGHRSMRMTMHYARIADDTVAEEYFRVTEAVEAGYRHTTAQPHTGAEDRQRAAEAHRRLLGNGHCGRPVGLDCNFESICERCGFFDTGPEFIPILRRQRDHADERAQHDRAVLFDGIITAIADHDAGGSIT